MIRNNEDKAVEIIAGSVKQMISLQTAVIGAQLAAIWTKAPYPKAEAAMQISVAAGGLSIVAALLCLLSVASDLLDSKTPRRRWLITLFAASWFLFLLSSSFGALFAFRMT